MVLSGRNRPDNGVCKDFLVHTYSRVNTAEAFVVAVVSEYRVWSKLKCLLCPFQIHSVVQAMWLPSPPCWPLNTQFLFSY